MVLESEDYLPGYELQAQEGGTTITKKGKRDSRNLFRQRVSLSLDERCFREQNIAVNNYESTRSEFVTIDQFNQLINNMYLFICDVLIVIRSCIVCTQGRSGI